jgi:DNA-binding NarL/FixJ family response regulator
VVGLLHADRYLQGRDTDVADREVLLAFSHGLRLALSRAAVAGQLQSAADVMTLAAADADQALDAVHTATLDVSRAASERRSATFSPQAMRSVRDVLTRREVEVLELLAEGLTNAGVGTRLWISEGTVKQHVKHILHKLRVGNRVEAVSRLYQSADH